MTAEAEAEPPPPPLRPRPTADDLLSILSVGSAVIDGIGSVGGGGGGVGDGGVGNGGGGRAARGGDDATAAASCSASWQDDVSVLPSGRRSFVREVRSLADALDGWGRARRSASREARGAPRGKEGVASGDDGEGASPRAEAAALDEVEGAASALRDAVSAYRGRALSSIDSLTKFWLPDGAEALRCASELARAGGELSSRLVRQLRWDLKLCEAIVSFLDSELYADGDRGDGGIDGRGARGGGGGGAGGGAAKLRAWASAADRAFCADAPFWRFVERAVHDELELDRAEEEGDAPELLNDEPSSRFVPIEELVGTAASKDEEGQSKDSVGREVAKGSLGLRDFIASSSSADEAAERFLRGECGVVRSDAGSIATLLLAGEEGCGKTHLLDALARSAALSAAGGKGAAGSAGRVVALRPTGADLTGNVVGSSEDRLVALFAYAERVASEGGRCLVLLDDVDALLSCDSGGDGAAGAEPRGAQHRVGLRRRALFLSILDALRDRPPSVDAGRVLLLCAARSVPEEISGRFDRIFRMGRPDEDGRRRLIASCLSPADVDGVSSPGGSAGVAQLLSLAVQHSAGRSASELARCCREAVLSCAREDDDGTSSTEWHEGSESAFERRLRRLEEIFRSRPPPSLRGGSLDGVVDMRVYTPEELRSGPNRDADGNLAMPLLGKDAERAKEMLMNAVITPLCQSDEINDLLYGGGTPDGGGGTRAESSVRAGALLTGPPGCGKSTLAHHCASLAACLHPRVSLLDVHCASLVRKEMGGSERAVRSLFASVRAAAPCVLLLEGIEDVAPERGNDATEGGTMDRMLSTFLTEMDGIESHTEIDGAEGAEDAGGVAIIGVTRDPRLLDPALLRPGRLGKTIILGTPDFDARREIASRQIQNVDIDFSSAGYFDPKSWDDVARFVALESAGRSAAEVVAICREASMECLREMNFELPKEGQRPKLRFEHFRRASGIVKGGAVGTTNLGSV
ncbi:hypothetical protein ACHAWF_013654 [Thalassiosira exigua]